MPSSHTFWKSVTTMISMVMVVLSCGRTKPQYEQKSDDQSTTTTSPTTAGNVAIASGDVEIPAGAVAEDGTVITMTETDEPDQFVQDPPLAVGSLAINISGDAPSGPVEELIQPVTVTLKIADPAPAAALMEAPAEVLENQCVLGVTPSGKLLVWRFNSLLDSDATASEIKFKSKWLGTFEIVFCGNVTLGAFAEVSQNGSSEIAPTLSSFGACDYSALTDLSTLSCRMYTGIAFKPVANLDSNKASCVSAGGTYVDGGSCPETSVVGSCIVSKDGDEEINIMYYSGTTVALSSIKTQCESNTGSVWEQK